MKYVTDNELKRNGISVANEAVAEYGEAVISVRGKSKYVILDTETYNPVMIGSHDEAYR